jgi:hypothetical protein
LIDVSVWLDPGAVTLLKLTGSVQRRRCAIWRYRCWAKKFLLSIFQLTGIRCGQRLLLRDQRISN